MDRFEGDDNDGPDYVFLGDSGVVNIGEMSRRGERIRSEEAKRDREIVARLLKNSELFRRRADIRNGLRIWFEKIPCLADLLDYPYLKKMSAQEVYDEHCAIVEKKVARERFPEQENKTGALMIPEDDGNPDKDVTTLKREEFAKQTAYKFDWYVRHDGVDFAAGYIKRMLDWIGNEALKREIVEQVRLKSGEILSRLIREKKPHDAVFAFYSFGSLFRFERKDLFEVKDEELRDPLIKKAFLEALSRTVGVDAGMSLYEGVRGHMEEMGFFSADEANSSGAIRVEANRLLDKAMEEHAIVYREVLCALNKAGLQQATSEAASWRRMVLVSRLAKMMEQSPGLYAANRDKWGEWGILDTIEADGDGTIAEMFNAHLGRCFKESPYFYNKMKYHWRKSGLTEYKANEEMYAASVNWILKVEFEGSPVTDMTWSAFENEKQKELRLIENDVAEENNCMLRFRRFYQVQKEHFEGKYPQYADNAAMSRTGRDGKK